MDLPTVLYRCPGPHSRAGGSYDYLGIETPEAHDKALADGWQLTMPDAIGAFENKKAEVIAQVDKEMAQEQTPERKKPGPKPKPKAE